MVKKMVKNMKKINRIVLRYLSQVGAVLAINALVIAPSAIADTWIENPDAGELPATSQTPVGTGELTTISGTLPTLNDVDMYQICIDDPLAFSAQTSGNITDPQLSLFDAAGFGVVHNDD